MQGAGFWGMASGLEFESLGFRIFATASASSNGGKGLDKRPCLGFRVVPCSVADLWAQSCGPRSLKTSMWEFPKLGDLNIVP